MQGRKCSHCGLMGHNSRTCCTTYKGANYNNGLIKLFGVQLDVHSFQNASTANCSFMKKSFSLDCLGMGRSSSSSSSSSSFTSSPPANSSSSMKNNNINGYLSDGLFGRTSQSQERKKGVPWTEEEHMLFLRGLKKQGKGDWRGVSRNYVKSRTPTQVASHAQKYFLRQASLLNNKKRRSSLFDMSGDEIKMDDHHHHHHQDDHCSADFASSSSTTERPSSSEYLCFKSIMTSPPPPAAAATKTLVASINSDNNNNNNGGSEPELELTLSMAAPETIGQDKPSHAASSFLLGRPIKV